MSGSLRLVALALAFVVGAHASARADDATLARLRRLARGEWTASPPSVATAVPYAAQIRRAARSHGVPPALLAALVRAESAFDPRAVSSAGARGLGQLMPATARELGVRDPFDPRQNLDGAARYLALQLRRFRSPRLALFAYHAGPQRAVMGWGRAPRTTREYVARVLRFEREYRHGAQP